MPKQHHPRRGSLAVRPRKRANTQNVRVRNWPSVSENKLLAFAGYKAGMTHIIMKDSRAGIAEKNATLSIPVTIIECPPLKVIGFRGYKKDIYGLCCATQKFVDNITKIDKHLSKTLILPKKAPKSIELNDLDKIRILVCTQPSKTNIGKKKPEVFEIALGGKQEEQLKLAESLLGKEIKASDVFKEGEELDTSSVTKGKGFQGPVKRHGVKIRFHKSEKTKRGPGSLGPWHGPRTWKVPHAGQMGYHQRSEYNKQVFLISDKTELINPKGGFINYGTVKNDFIMIKGSIGGPKKRLIKLIYPIRPNKKPFKLSKIEFINQESQQ